MSHRKSSSYYAGKTMWAGVCLGLAAIIAFGLFLHAAYDTCVLVHFPFAAEDSGADPSDVVIFAREPRIPGEDDSCTIWAAASDFEMVLLPEQTVPANPSPAAPLTYSDPIPCSSRFKMLVQNPRSPPSFL